MNNNDSPYPKRARKKKNRPKVLLICFGLFLIVFLLSFLFLKKGIGFSFKEDSFLSDFSSKNNSSGKNLFFRAEQNALFSFEEIATIQENSLVAISSPLTVSFEVLGGITGDSDLFNRRKEIIEYEVKPGDSLSSIAERFGISLNTILWANDLSRKSVIKAGQKLVILPVSGLVHQVRKGDTISEIARKYKAKVSEIIAFNELSDEGDIFVGDVLVIPNGVKPSTSRSIKYAQIPLGKSYFICPHSACIITQGLHWYNAVDFGGKCGDPIYAVAAGTVQRVKYGWNGGAGNYITILHPNGVVTMYGHIQKALVSPGQKVSQGEIIALMGGKPGTPGAGISTGCHVHFDVRGTKNPFAK